MKTAQEIQARQREITDRLSDLAGFAQNRELNAAELAEEVTLQREFRNNSMAITMQNQDAECKRNAPVVTSAQRFREIALEAVRSGQKRDVTLSVVNVSDTNNIRTSGAIELSIQEMLPVLEKGLIWDKVGLKMITGVGADLIWPYATNSGVAEEVGETVALTDADINFGKKTATPYRVGAEVDVTREALEDAAFDLSGFVVAELNRKIQRLLNKKLFGTPNFTGLRGPWYNTTPDVLNLTYANIKTKKALVAATGVDMASFAYVCDNKTKALLESTPKANGQGGMIMENGMIDGDPVFVTEWINIKSDGSFYSDKYYLGMGAWGEIAGCQHGAITFTIDPYTNAGKNEVRFIVNTRFSITNLATDAAEFGIYNLSPVYDGTVGVTIANTESNPVNTKEVSAE